jgi:hypothetical protein
MTRNQKIALGCGGAGCLGLILVVVLIVVLSAAGYMSWPGSTNRNYNYNSNSNTNRNSNYNYNSNINRNSNSSSSSSSSMSSDAKHKLFQAAAATNDSALARRVWEKLGFLNANGTPNDQYAEFVKEHISWLFRNSDFIDSINTPAKARAYVEEHLED